MNIKPDSNKFFEKYLKEHKLRYECENFKGQKQPDYLVYSKYGNVICEVKEFNSSGKDPYAPIRAKINKAKEKFREYKKQNIPRVLVLSNALNKPISLADDWVLGAMYGNINVALPIDLPIAATKPNLYFKKDGKLRNCNTTISAIAILEKVVSKSDEIILAGEREKNPLRNKSTRERANHIHKILSNYPNIGNRILRMRVYHNRNAKNPLNKDVFCGEENEHYEYDSGNDIFILVKR